MNEKTTKKTADRDDDKELRAGVSVEEEREAKKVSREDADEEVLAEVAVEEPVVALLKELPDDGVVQQSPLEMAAAAAPQDAPHGNAYNDQFHGQGGSFIIDAESGERKRQYEEVKDAKGKTLGYRPVL